MKPSCLTVLHQPTRKSPFAGGALALLLVALIVLVLATSVTAQDNPLGFTPQPTSEFDLNSAPTFGAPQSVPTVDPQMLPSISGVGGQAANASVIIRSGPGLTYRPISSLKKDGWIDIVGWNGWEDGRACTVDFESTLDMWVQVQFGERRGWIARCVLDIRGQLTKLPIVSAAGERILQQ